MGIVNWVRTGATRIASLFFRERRNPPLTTILIGPDYGNEATAILSSLVAQLPVPSVSGNTYVEVGKGVTRYRIEEILRDTRGHNRIKIFVGHGARDALLGPALFDFGDKNVQKGRLPRLYDADLITDEIASLFAFCCKTAKELGPKFSEPPLRTFLGFNEVITYELTNDECVDTWRNIIQTVALNIIDSTTITQATHEFMTTLYNEAIGYYLTGDGQHNDRRLTMLTALLRQRKYLTFCGAPE